MQSTIAYLAQVAFCLLFQDPSHIQIARAIADRRRDQVLAQISVSFERLDDLHPTHM